jgi:cell shape-determining protein MreD
MRGAALPAALLCAAIGLAFAFVPRKAVLPGLILFCGGAVAGHLIPVGGSGAEIAFVACWAAIILLAASVHWPRGLPAVVAILVGAIAGIIAGIVIAAEGVPSDLLRALPLLLLVFPARLAIRRQWQIAIKVMLSWLAAVALLAALLPTTATPGYVPDHMD